MGHCDAGHTLKGVCVSHLLLRKFSQSLKLIWSSITVLWRFHCLYLCETNFITSDNCAGTG